MAQRRIERMSVSRHRCRDNFEFRGKFRSAIHDGTIVPHPRSLGRFAKRGSSTVKNLGILGAVLIVLGVGALLFGHFTYSETKPVLKVGPLQINSQEDHTVWIPTVGGIVVVLAGLGLVMAGRRSS